MRCRDIPEILTSEPRATACRRLADALPCCLCELESVRPDLSPGIVEDAEILARFVPERDFDSESGTVKPSLFAHAGSIGMSVTRIDRAGRNAMVEQQMAKAYIGYVTAVCDDVRQILANQRRAFCVYDTALPGNPAHADVCQTQFGMKKSEESDLRRRLLRIFDSKLVFAQD